MNQKFSFELKPILAGFLVGFSLQLLLGALSAVLRLPDSPGLENTLGLVGYFGGTLTAAYLAKKQPFWQATFAGTFIVYMNLAFKEGPLDFVSLIIGILTALGFAWLSTKIVARR